LYYLLENSKLQNIEWDVATVTAGDFSVEYHITHEMYDNFIAEHYDRVKYQSPGMALKCYLKYQIEEICIQEFKKKKLADALLNRDANDKDLDRIEVADIVFAFNNAKLITLLKERGHCIINQDFEKQKTIEEQIMELKRNDYDALTRPVCAFITFAEEEGFQTALRFEEPEDKESCKNPKLLGEPLYFGEATEPTNIIWENRHLTTLDMVWRAFVVVSACSLLLFGSFTVIFICQQEAIAIKLKYPLVECNDFYTTYGNSLTSIAYQEYMNYYHNKDDDPTPMAGALKCFCEKQAEENGSMSTWGGKYEITGKEEVALCTEWYFDQWKGLLSQMVGYFIIGINFVLRLFLIQLICMIGQHTESSQTNSITNGVLLVQFFNTAILLLFVNANMSQQSSVLGYVFKGNLPDFSQVWYTDIGNTLVGAMIFNVMWPIIEFFVFWFQREGLRILDKGLSGFTSIFTSQSETTKTITIY